ncbi:19483_t:CDS:1 [Funneliformis geosporum]|uniref:10131_t:CDS:1 n=1 Tax=Funneliformis geosporum TaxID=1117311 RepID=A0A9W4SPQ5_9GLOM|nr:19483_t:CDS:1 [Funneliformis geosporum]CAI2175992.1 10131_t:CDS:1 [Funneliformis geosporum]
MFHNFTKHLQKRNAISRLICNLPRKDRFHFQVSNSISIRSSFIHSTKYSFKDEFHSHPNSFQVHSDPSHSSTQSTSSDISSTSQHNSKARLLIAFTCKVCSYRSTKTMSRHAYDHGVVIIQCSSCQNRHLIADHLGWFRDGKTTIEDLMREQGEKVLKFVDKTRLDVLEWCPDIINEEKRKLKELKKSKNRKELSLGLNEKDKVDKPDQ